MNIFLLTGHSFIGKNLLSLLSKEQKKHKILCLSRSNDQTIKKKYFLFKV